MKADREVLCANISEAMKLTDIELRNAALKDLNIVSLSQARRLIQQCSSKKDSKE